MKKILLSCLVLILILSGCSNSTSGEYDNNKNVNYVQAKELIINKGAIIVDVRTKDEYDENHIDGAVLLPVDDITEEKAKEIINSKDDVIIVYCKSGVRSSKAASALDKLGYHNVYNLGSINNWKE